MFSANQIEIKYAKIKLNKNVKMKFLINNRKEDTKIIKVTLRIGQRYRPFPSFTQLSIKTV